MKFQKAVVTGGAGFIGSHIVDALCNAGIDVCVIDNLSLGKKENINSKSVFHKFDITNLAKIKPLIKGADIVFHCAALPSVQYSIDHPETTGEVNIKGTMNVLIASHDGGVKRVIYSASSASYGDQEALPFTEDMVPNPKSPYALEKLTSELYCKAWSAMYGLQTVSLRYFNVYGKRQVPDGPYGVVGRFLELKKKGKSFQIFGDGEQTRDFVHVSDVVRANMISAESGAVGKGEVINIGSGESVSINKIAKLIGGKIEYLPPRIEPRHTCADISLARKILGWSPEISFEEGLNQLLRN